MEQLKLGRGVTAVGAMGTEPEVAFDPEKAFVSSRGLFINPHVTFHEPQALLGPTTASLSKSGFLLLWRVAMTTATLIRENTFQRGWLTGSEV